MQGLELDKVKIERVFSAERLSTYRTAFARRLGGSEFQLYQWNTLLAESLYPLLQAIEVILRNAMFTAIANHFNDPTWIMSDKILVHRDVVSVKKQEIKLRTAQQDITMGKIISELNFGFWTGLLDSRYEMTLWRTKIIKQVFPNISPKDRMRHKLAKHFNRIRKLRNRVFHYEPIWYWLDLQVQHDEILQAISWIEPECLKLVDIDRFPEIYRQGLQP